MIKINSKDQFKRLCLQLESLENQLYNTFDLKTKDFLNSRIENIKWQIDKILDEYNQK